MKIGIFIVLQGKSLHDQKDGRFSIFCPPLGNPQCSLVYESLQSPAINKTVLVTRPGLSQTYFTMDLWGICTYYNKNDLPVEYTLKMLLSFKCIAIHKKTEAQSSYLHSSQTFYFHSSELCFSSCMCYPHPTDISYYCIVFIQNG